MGSPTTLMIFGPKRKRSNANEQGEDWRFDPAKADKRLKPSVALDVRLACPFFKNDLAKHQDCFKAAYQTWAHVKQHLRRKHYVEPVDHSRLSHDSSDMNWDKDGPSRDRTVAGGLSIDDTIGNTQMQLIEEKTKARLMSDGDRWNVAWGILFPQVVPPTTPYAQNLVDEFMHYAWRGIPDLQQPFDTGLVNESLAMSPEASKAVVIQFACLLKRSLRRQQSASSCRGNPRRYDDNTAVLTSIPTRVDTEITSADNPQLDNNNFTFPHLDTAAPALAGTVDVLDYNLCEEDTADQGLLSDHVLWEGLE
ncbi:hypothetical protein CGCVW01_v006790 [Colletotrichum viniferum]|nr:hypothetical protein CGCVW01_v006790 [Colletotrichum viniferum]